MKAGADSAEVIAIPLYLDIYRWNVAKGGAHKDEMQISYAGDGLVLGGGLNMKVEVRKMDVRTIFFNQHENESF